MLLRGPAACGKTSAALAIYRRYCADWPGACILLAPNAASVTATRRRLLADAQAGVIVAARVMTFTDLAARVLADAGAPAPLSAPRRQVMLRQIVDRLLAGGKLAVLGRVADTPGVISALDRAIAELKRAAVEPETLAKAVARTDKKGADLLAVYEACQQRLHEEQAYDLEGLMWLARDRLAASPDSPPRGLDGVEAVVADGFTDFTPTQLEMLVLFSGMLRRVVITLPHDDDGRERLWHWTARTADNVRRAFGDRLAELHVDQDERSRPTALAPLWDAVFDFDAAPRPLPAGLSLIAASGIEAEVAAVARRVKRLLAGAAEPGSIAVLARAVDTYRPTIERIFAAFDIPIRQAAQPLRDCAIVRFALDAAGLGGEYAYRDVLRVIKSSYFRPRALGEFDATTTAAAEFVIRYGNISAGRNAYARSAERIAEQLAAGTAPDDEDQPIPPAVEPGDIRRAGEMFEALFDLCDAARGASDRRGALGMLADRLQLRAAACDHEDDETIARDLRALAALEAVLAELPSPPPPLDHVRLALAAASCPPPRGPAAVDVLGVLDARAMSFRHVFCLGAGEGHFPRRFQDSSLISQRDRLAWADRGVSLDTRDDLTAREMLLFYLAVSRAAETLTLSFMDSDAAGRPAEVSSFVTSLLATAGGWEAAEQAGIVERIPPGRFLPAPDELAGETETLTAAVAGLFSEGCDPAGAALGYLARTAAHHAATVAPGLLARRRRWRRGPCDAYDGRITDADSLAQLARQFGDQAVFSASQLNAYGACPWQFFAAHVLSLRPLEAPTDRLTALDRGLFCHKVLCATFVELAARHGEGFHLAAVASDELTAALDQAAASASAAVEARGVAYPALWRIQRQRMRDDMREYLLAEHAATAELSAESLHFELPFGLDDADGDHGAVTIATAAGPFRLRGRIDRIDRIKASDRRGLLVVDYKTGQPPTRKDIDAGRALQLPLYSAAAAQLLGEECLGGAFHQVGRDNKQTYLAVVKRWGETFRGDADFEKALSATIDKAGLFVGSIRSGRFDALPTHKCPTYCPFRRICQYAKHRAPLKADAEQEGGP